MIKESVVQKLAEQDRLLRFLQNSYTDLLAALLTFMRKEYDLARNEYERYCGQASFLKSRVSKLISVKTLEKPRIKYKIRIASVTMPERQQVMRDLMRVQLLV